jgi:predicted transcriptional regulator
MGITMSKRPIRDKNEISILILLVFRRMESAGEGVSFQALSDAMLWEGTVNYFDFSGCLAELMDNGAAEEFLREGKLYYRITEKGEELYFENKNNWEYAKGILDQLL